MGDYKDFESAQIPRKPEDACELRAWLLEHLKLTFPIEAVCQHHHSPFDYLVSSFFEPSNDLIVWAPRGGGKTRLGAVATLLDLLYKPDCSIRILGGSLEQSLRMWEHLWPDIRKLAEHLIDKKLRSTRKISLTNGSSASILPQSERAVRGLRVQKLRCDEVEMFDKEVWEAAQLITRSKPNATGTIEVFSTMHKPGGLMSRIVDQAESQGRAKVIKWCILEVLERCPAERVCETCPLHEDCGGIAKEKCNGFISIDDAIAYKQRVSADTWQSEMLCRKPSVRDCVFGAFDPQVHVLEHPPLFGERDLWLGIDFGFANPFVALWIAVYPNNSFHVIDEYVQQQRQMYEHIEIIKRRPHGHVRAVACDPAGNSRNDQTARSNVQLLKEAGFDVKTKGSFILDGLEKMRAALKPAHGQPRLYIHPRCKRLIAAMHAYRYAEGGSEIPLKDNNSDHLMDALRYFFVNYSSSDGPNHRRY